MPARVARVRPVALQGSGGGRAQPAEARAQRGGGRAEAEPARGLRSLSVAGLLFLRGRDADARLRAIEVQRASVRPVLGELAARLADGRAWRALGFRNRSDYARERLGVGGRVVSEWARVWRALGELPRLREAVLAGEVSWTVARLVVGVATLETEAACLETVRGRTVRAVEALLAAARAQEDAARGVATPYDGIPSGPDEDGEERVGVRIACPPAIGGKWNAALELARRMAGAQLPVWGCAEAMVAEVAAALSPEPESSSARLEERTAASKSSADAPCPDTAVGLAWPPAEGRSSASGAAASPASMEGSSAALGESGSPVPGRDPSHTRCPSSALEGATSATAVPGISSRAAGAQSGDRARGPVGPRDPEPGLRASAFPHLSWSPVGARLPAESARELRNLVEGVEECGPHELDRRLKAAVAFLQSLDAELGRILRQVVIRELYREMGFESFEHYVRERLDTAPRTARRLVRLARAEHRAPAVANAFREGRITTFQAEVLLGVIEHGGRRRPHALDGIRKLSDIDGLHNLSALNPISGRPEPRGNCAGAGGGGGDGDSVAESSGAAHGNDGSTEPGGGWDVGDGDGAGRSIDGGCGRPAGGSVEPRIPDAGRSPNRAERRPEAADVEAEWLSLAQRMTLRRLELEANAEPRAAITFHAPRDVAAFFQDVLDHVDCLLAGSGTANGTGTGAPSSGTANGTGAGARGNGAGTGNAGVRGAGRPRWSALEVVLDHVIVAWVRAGWADPRWKLQDYADFDRDGCRCTMPGCTARSRLERHHVRYRSNGGPDIPENRTTLCWLCRYRHNAHYAEHRIMPSRAEKPFEIRGFVRQQSA